LVVVSSKVAGLPTIEARETSRCELLRWPSSYMLLRCSRVTVLLLQLELLLLVVVLWVIAPVLLWRSARLSCGWDIDHTILQRSTS
jgi:hypothetical protein